MTKNPNRRTVLKLAGAGAAMAGLSIPHIALAQADELEVLDGVALGPALGADLAHRAHEVLDVVPVLVREHIRLDELAGGTAELLLEHLVEERGVEVDALVRRAVERPDL